MQILLFALQDLVSFLSVWHGDPSIRGPSIQAVQNGQERFSDNFERFFSLLPPLIFILRSFTYESASLQLVLEPTAGACACRAHKLMDGPAGHPEVEPIGQPGLQLPLPLRVSA